jgi:hypothetical protein
MYVDRRIAIEILWILIGGRIGISWSVRVTNKRGRQEALVAPSVHPRQPVVIVTAQDGDEI